MRAQPDGLSRSPPVRLMDVQAPYTPALLRGFEGIPTLADSGLTAQTLLRIAAHLCQQDKTTVGLINKAREQLNKAEQ